MKITGLCCAFFLLVINLCVGQSNAQVENAAAFARLYGYVRFFHPSDEAAGLDWNRFAIYGAKQVEGCRNPQELAATLRALFQPIAPTVQIYTGNKPVASLIRQALTPPDTAGYKVVSWQHEGVKVGNKDGIYKSIRTNRSHVAAGHDPGSGNILIRLNGENYRNKEFIFKANTRLRKGPGTGHLWFRADKTDKKAGFFSHTKDRTIKSADWREHEIKGKIGSDPFQLAFGAFLKGAGELWVDNLSIQIKEGDSWKEVYLNSFEEEDLGQPPVSVSNTSVSYTYEITALPESGAGRWLTIRKPEPADVTPAVRLFNKHAQVGEYADKDIGGGLRAIIPFALYGTPEQTFPEADKNKLHQLQETLWAFSTDELTGKNRYVRLADIAIAWNIFQHFYAYFDVAKTDWQQDLIIALKSAYTGQTEADFKRTLQKLTAKLKDGHVWVALATEKYTPTYSAPITWEWVENQLVVTNNFDTTLPLAVGDVVTHINGETAEQYFGQVHQYISAATKGYLNHRAEAESLLGQEGSTLQLKIRKAGNATAEVTLRRNWSAANVFAAQPQADSIKQLAPGIMYLNLDKVSMAGINNMMPQLQQSKAIICDLRGYPNNNHDFIEHLLTQEDTTSQWLQIPQIIYPDQENITGYYKPAWDMKPRHPHLTAKVVFIMDGQAISYAESYLSYIDHYQLATMVGQPSAGTNGGINPFVLPGGYRISWTGMKVIKHDGSPLHGVGILPDVYVERTIKGIRENRDEFLEKAFEIAKRTE
jgi:C-terminal processing protease CtpA/Prc